MQISRIRVIRVLLCAGFASIPLCAILHQTRADCTAPFTSSNQKVIMLGNLLLLITCLFLWGLLQVTATPMPGGDKGVGYAFMMVICAGGFFVLSGLLAWYMGANHYFNWVKIAPIGVNRLILGVWLMFAFSVMAMAVFRVEWHKGEFPAYLHWLALNHAALWLPVLMFVPIALLINTQKPADTAPLLIKIPMLAAVGCSVVMGSGLLWGYVTASVKNQTRQLEEYKNAENQQQKQHLEYIAQQQLTDPIVNILSLTGRYTDAVVRNAAIEKVKMHPNWEDELIRLLAETEWASEVYSFIDGNKVQNPHRFVEPLKAGMHRLAATIRTTIKDSNNLQNWQFDHMGLDRLFRAIDEQFLLPNANYRPAVLELRKALDTPKPERFEKVKFNVTPLIDKWLKKHSNQ